ncbi:autotransporter outer membrane beta-barrel domain-containing protein, partial [Brucella anthropi]|uniref:autotransporter outer membrane beta-barrel domain-containing protein n=1 Tax=Brucella anthropi TaxID=529 RepID=UPI00235FDF98
LLSAGADNSLSAASAYVIDSSSALDLGGFSATVGALSNKGTVHIGGATPGAVLTVAGNYTGQTIAGFTSGVVAIGTVLGDDGSKTDMLKVQGDTSGRTQLQVTNVGGAGAQTVNGIKVVEVGGQSDGTFLLSGSNSYTTKDGQVAIVGGAYGYTLHKGTNAAPSDGSWYLTSALTNPTQPVDPDCKDTNSCQPPVNPTDPTDPTNPTNPTNPTGPSGPRYSASVPVYEGYVATM